MLSYLARYTHRTAIANSRLLAVDDDEVAFSERSCRIIANDSRKLLGSAAVKGALRERVAHKINRARCASLLIAP